VEEIPLTGHGKVWREKVEEWARGEAPEGIGEGGASGKEEEELLKVWEEVLGVSGIGVHDNFFDLGGHSLLATQVISRIAMVFQVEMPLRALFEAPTVAALAQRIKQTRGPQMVSLPPISAVDRGGRLPVSFAQQRLWFLELVQPGSSLFHMSAAMRLDGDLNIDALRHSLNQVVRRHEILSARFAIEDGQPVVMLSENPAELPLPVVDLEPAPEVEQEAQVRRLAKQEAHTGFDLIHGPLIRARLLRLNAKSHALLVTIHHIVADGWSMGVLTREVGALYAAFVAGETLSPAPLPIQYVDYAAWQRDILQGDFLDGLLAYWSEQLSGELPALNLPLDYTRPSVQTFNGARAPLTIPAEVMNGLDALNRQMGTTLFMTLLGALQALLCRYAGQEDIITGALVANRHRMETEGLIGCFINALAIRTDLSGDPTFQQLLARVRRVSLEAYAHQDLPFEKLVDVLQPERDLSRPPIFQVMFSLQNFPLEELRLPSAQLTPLPVDTDSVAYDLTFSLAEKDGALFGDIEYNTDLFAPETVERMAVHYLTLLEGAMRDPSQNISRLPLLSASERRQLLVDWNQTAKDYPLNLRFDQVFEQQVAATPEATAVVTDQAELSYAELNAMANRMARALLAHGVGPDTVVALFSARGWELLAAIIAVFKAGGAYMPLDPAYPVKRLSQIIGRSGCRLALSTAQLGGQMEQALFELEDAARPRALVIEDLLNVDLPRENLALRNSPNDLAYVLFTSGSTGAPKGAMIEQCGMMNHLFAKVDDLELTRGDTIAQNASQCFDISVWQFLAALIVGGRVRIVNDDLRHDPLGLLTLVDEEGISILEVVPSLLQAMLEEVADKGAPKMRLSALRWLIATGEALPPQLVRKWQALYPVIPMLNAYGPTECSDDVTHHRIVEALPERVMSTPIGGAIANMRMYALDKRLEPTPVGVAGELYVGGIGVGRGYLGEPDRTAEVFIPDPFVGNGARLYRTGDLVSYLPDGSLKFLGRVDHQVKIRGFRIELGEIETVLRDHPMVAEALVLDHEDDRGEKLLTGYVVPHRLGDDDQSGFWSDEQVGQWQQVFESVYSQVTDLPDGSLNLSGWVSSYTGEHIPEEEMRVWVETTVENILSLKPGRVLEIGCGAGLLLLRLAPHCDKYWGTDFAPGSLQYLQQQLDQRHTLSADIRLLQRAADNFADIEPDTFDAVVINSIAQYFPNVDYLIRVLEGAVSAVAPGGFIYIGDVRNLRLLEAFHLSVQLAKASPELRREELARRAQQAMGEEAELLLDPDFFHAFKSRFSKVGQVEIHLKRGRYHNELTRFRYDVVLHIGAAEKKQVDAPCLNWEADRLTIPLVERNLYASQPEILTLTQIPNARLTTETCALRWLSGAEDEPQTVGDWMSGAASETGDAVDPEDLLALAERYFYDIVISGGRSGPEGYFDAMLTRKGSSWGRAQNPALAGLEPPADALAKPWSQYSNNPLQGVVSAKLLPQLRAFLKEKLPDYMVPAVFLVLESLPLTANGKVDRRALPKPHASTLKHEGTYVEARTPTEQTVSRIWRQVLGLHRIGVHEKFFDIGGDSLKIVRAFRLLQEAYPGALTVVDLFKHNSIEAVSAFLDAASKMTEAEPELQGVEL
jgi:amino acid adenylation domain-containing protein